MSDGLTSKKVFELRKNKQLSDAYSLALKLIEEDSNDEWTQKAYAWVLIDIIKIEIGKNNLNQANQFFNQLNSINFYKRDEIIDKQIQYIQPKLNVNFQEVLQAENLSKNGNHQASLNIFRNLYKNGKLTTDNLDSYGWAVYRYLKNNYANIELDEVKRMLFAYLNLKNLKPSLLHSVILQFTVMYSSNKKEFDFYRFLQIWNPQYFRDEDRQDQYKDGKTYPSLVKKVLRILFETNSNIDLNYLTSKIGDQDLVIETFRESYFWKLFNLHKNENYQTLWKDFNFYVSNYSNIGASHWHSEILKLANRFMTEDNTWRFFDFFIKWNYKNFRNEDWQEEHNGEHIYKPLAVQSISLVNEYIKNKNINNNSLLCIEELYKVALENIGHDKWLLRNYAILLNRLNKQNDAIKIYNDIILDLSDQAYIWHEFSSLVANKDLDLAISMLCKAVTIQKNEDFLSQVHLDLASLLVKTNEFPEAKAELIKYENQRNLKGWKLSDQFNQLNQIVGDIKQSENNKEFYYEKIDLAEDYIYSEIEWTDLILYDHFTTKDKKKRLLFSDFNDIELMVNPFKFSILKNAKKNEVFKFKLYFDQINEKYMVLKVNKSELVKEDMLQNASSDIAIVDHVNEKKELFHYIVDRSNDGIVRFNQTKIKARIGDFIEIKYFKTFNKKQNKYKLNILDILETNETKDTLIKESTGNVRLNINKNGDKFGFIDDYYIPPHLVSKYNLVDDELVSVKILFNGEKWNVYHIENY